MARQQVSSQSAYVLRSRPYRETSLLVEFFTRHHGRISVLSKGCKKGRRSTQGLYLPFKPLQISWAGRGDLPILTAIEQDRCYPDLTPNARNCGFYVNELITKLLYRHDSHERLFDRYHASMLDLMLANDLNTILRIFEKHLLGEIGFGLVLDRDIGSGEIIVPDRKYRYMPQRGPVLCAAGADEALDAIDGDALIALHEENFQTGQQRKQAKRLTRMLIDIQLQSKELRTRRVIHECKRFHSEHAL